MARKSLSRRFPIPNTKEEVIKYLNGKNPSGKKSLPYWDDEYDKCYFRPRVAGKKTTQYFVSLLGIETKEDCKKIKMKINKHLLID